MSLVTWLHVRMEKVSAWLWWWNYFSFPEACESGRDSYCWAKVTFTCHCPDLIHQMGRKSVFLSFSFSEDDDERPEISSAHVYTLHFRLLEWKKKMRKPKFNFNEKPKSRELNCVTFHFVSVLCIITFRGLLHKKCTKRGNYVSKSVCYLLISMIGCLFHML